MLRSISNEGSRWNTRNGEEMKKMPCSFSNYTEVWLKLM